jgi:hypothetical protein
MDDVCQYIQRHAHRLSLAEVAPNEHIQRSLLRVAELYEREVGLIERARTCLSESREMLAKVEARLAGQFAAQLKVSSLPKDALRKAV